MYDNFPTAFNLNGEGVNCDVSVSVGVLYSYPLNIASLTRRRFSLTSPKVRSN